MNTISKIIVPLLFLIVLFVYIGLSTNNINDEYYRELAWKTVGKNNTILDWTSAEVEVVKINNIHIAKSPQLSGRISYSLMFLNGGRAVRVHFRTEQDGLLGPIVCYFNPFTKQFIGCDFRY